MAEPIRFSIVTPTHKRPHSLLRMLEALARQDYPFDCFEVIVIVCSLPRTFRCVTDTPLGGRDSGRASRGFRKIPIS